MYIQLLQKAIAKYPDIYKKFESVRDNTSLTDEEKKKVIGDLFDESIDRQKAEDPKFEQGMKDIVFDGIAKAVFTK